MFIKTKYAGYNRHDEQVAAGLFLILMQPRYDSPKYGNSTQPIKAIVRHTRMGQFGQFMMGSARIHGEKVILSGSYGSDGLPCMVSDRVYDSSGLVLPDELRHAWNHGGGWNSAGSEAPMMRKWALENLVALRK